MFSSGSKTDFLINCLDDSAWFSVEKLEKHVFETIWSVPALGRVGLFMPDWMLSELTCDNKLREKLLYSAQEEQSRCIRGKTRPPHPMRLQVKHNLSYVFPSIATQWGQSPLPIPPTPSVSCRFREGEGTRPRLSVWCLSRPRSNLHMFCP